MVNNFLMTSRAWRAIPAGWFVLAPNGQWLEVLATRMAGGRQHVTLRFPDGNEGVWPRDPASAVTCRAGKRALTEVDTVMAAFPGATVLEDEV